MGWVHSRGAALAFVFAAACEGTGTSGFPPSGGARDAGGGSTDGGGISFDDGGGGTSFGDSGGGGPSDCTGQAADYVYVLSVQNDLYSFAPDKKLFTKIGHLGCQTSLTPNSMAVDRSAVAWVNYVAMDDSQGVLYRVSTKDASCEASPAVTLAAPFRRVGMAFSTNGQGMTAETLFVSSDPNSTVINNGMSNHELGRVDMGTKQAVAIGPFTPTQQYQTMDAELTGTGDGRLYGFFVQPGGGLGTGPQYPLVGLVDKSSAAVQSPATMTGVQQPNDWAFSFWGGRFYLYTSVGLGSSVAEYDPANGNVNPSYMTNVGFDIVGAGVSTCAPTQPPQ